MRKYICMAALMGGMAWMATACSDNEAPVHHEQEAKNLDYTTDNAAS